MSHFHFTAGGYQNEVIQLGGEAPDRVFNKLVVMA